jgi:triacylglycerol lipase
MKMTFDFRQDDFDPDRVDNALALARFSKWVYAAPEDVVELLQREGKALDAVCQNHPNSSQFALARYNDGLILVFKGTKEARDWLVNLDAAKTLGPWRSRVHQGFWRALDSVWSAVSAALLAMERSRLDPLWITGHSLGGALATLAAARFTEERRRVHAVWTFGSPRVGDRVFSREFRLRIPRAIRFVNNEDLVARVPKFAYRHVGEKIYFDRHGRLLVNPSRRETWIDWMEEINFRSLKVTGADLRRHPGGIADHSIDRYLACLEKNMPASGSGQPGRPGGAFVDYING